MQWCNVTNSLKNPFGVALKSFLLILMSSKKKSHKRAQNGANHDKANYAINEADVVVRGVKQTDIPQIQQLQVNFKIISMPPNHI